MTSPIAAEIRALPPDQQLAAALAVIEDLTGQDNPGIRHLIETMGLSVGMARILWALHRASPHHDPRSTGRHLLGSWRCGRPGQLIAGSRGCAAAPGGDQNHLWRRLLSGEACALRRACQR